jgi:NYN domain
VSLREAEYAGSRFWLPSPPGQDRGRASLSHSRIRTDGRTGSSATPAKSARGSDEQLDEIRHALRDVGFRPTVFKRTGSRGAKGVDISLATDMLSNAHRDNFDVAILASGDEDFLPVVEEVQRLDKAVYLLSVGDKVSPGLILASDRNLDFGAKILQYCDQATAASGGGKV